MPTALSLFSGIGLHDLGLTRAGWTIAAQVELDPWCRAVLARHWPSTPRWEDVRHVSASALRGANVPAIDLVTGGFPCQQISAAGRGEGIGTEEAPTSVSGLWWEMLRLVRELGPRWVLAENVPALRTRGYEQVATSLGDAGYWHTAVVVGARHVGAPHRRLRVWIVGRRMGEPASLGRDQGPGHAGERRIEARGRRLLGDAGGKGMADPNGSGLEVDGSEKGNPQSKQPPPPGSGRAGVADANSRDLRHEPGRRSGADGAGEVEPGRGGAGVADANGGRLQELGLGGLLGGERPETRDNLDRRDRWPAGRGQRQCSWEPPRLLEPGLGRDPDGGSAWVERSAGGELRGALAGVSPLAALSKAARRLCLSWRRRQRLRALGNANPPHVPEIIGRWMIEQDRGAA